MGKNKEFCIFILTHGRPDKVLTYNTLLKAGCTYPIYFIIDNEDKSAEKYYENFGRDQVIIFDKPAISKTFDTGDNFDNRKCIIFARNACFNIARKLGYTYFLELDDDYTDFRYKFNDKGEYHDWLVHKNINKIFKATLNYFKTIPALTISYSQGGDFIGGKNSNNSVDIRIKRKAMNSFFCSVERPFTFIGRINEDVNTYVTLGARGKLIFQINTFALQQLPTQQNTGGMTDIYLDGGTYIKSFYSVMYAPSSVTVRLMGPVSPRLHHCINWSTAVPVILSEEYKKTA